MYKKEEAAFLGACKVSGIQVVEYLYLGIIRKRVWPEEGDEGVNGYRYAHEFGPNVEYFIRCQVAVVP